MTEPQTSKQFSIYLLSDRLIDALPYDYEDPAWRKILATPLPYGKVILTDMDIEAYNWEDQEIVLTTASSQRLPRLSEKTFIVYLGKEPVFGGSFIEQGSARAITYPVIYVNKSKSQVVLQIRPLHTMFENYRQLNVKLKRRIELPDVKNHFNRLKKIK